MNASQGVKHFTASISGFSVCITKILFLSLDDGPLNSIMSMLCVSTVDNGATVNLRLFHHFVMFSCAKKGENVLFNHNLIQFK